MDGISGGCFRRCDIFKHTEMHSPIFTFFFKPCKMWIVFIPGMFENDHPSAFQYPCIKNKFRDWVYPSEVKRRIGENNIILITTCLKKSKNVCSERFYLVKFQFFDSFLNKSKVFAVNLYKMNIGTSSWCKFIANTTCTCKKIKNSGSLKIKMINQDIEQTFLGFIGSRTCLNAFWRMYYSRPVFSAYYPQL